MSTATPPPAPVSGNSPGRSIYDKDEVSTVDDQPDEATLINDAVDAAVIEFDAFDVKLTTLIDTLKKRNAAMVAYNEARLVTAKHFHGFVAGTPMAKVVGSLVPASVVADAPTVEVIEETDDEESNASDEACASESVAAWSVVEGAKARGDEEVQVQGDNDDKIEDVLNTGSSEYHSSSTDSTESVEALLGSADEDRTQDAKDGTVIHDENTAKLEAEEAEKKVEKEGPPIDTSYMGVHLATYKLTNEHASQYDWNVVKYAERWHQVVTSRIKGRLVEFNKLKASLAHYVEKVDGLRGGVEKRISHNKTVSTRKSDKLERNELKLNGAREAHHIYGEGLLILMDEVANRGWKDIYPLLVSMVQFDMNHSALEAKLYDHLAESADLLGRIGAETGLTKEGRLRSLKESHPEEVYTGSKKIHAVISTQQHKAVEC